MYYWLKDSDRLSSTFCMFLKPSVVFFLFVELALNGYKDFINIRDASFFLL